ncbi:hypothetical protein SESBI_07283 [Sesbania bispinosa]|nr:hypothetical protein SESBI_07283 [Sesbania bispinosa]
MSSSIGLPLSLQVTIARLVATDVVVATKNLALVVAHLQHMQKTRGKDGVVHKRERDSERKRN